MLKNMLRVFVNQMRLLFYKTDYEKFVIIKRTCYISKLLYYLDKLYVSLAITSSSSVANTITSNRRFFSSN